MVREFTETKKKPETGHPAFALYDPILDAQTAKTALPAADDKQKTNLVTQLDETHLQATMPNGKCWTFELNKPAETTESGRLSNNILCEPKSFTDPNGTNWHKQNGEWLSNTPSGLKRWSGHVLIFGSDISFRSDDGLGFGINAGNINYISESLYIDNHPRFTIDAEPINCMGFASAWTFKQDLLKFLPELSRNGSIDRDALNSALKDPSTVGLKAVVLAALDENFADVAGFDPKIVGQPQKLSLAALDKFNSIANSPYPQSREKKLGQDTTTKIIERVSDSLTNGYLDMSAYGPDKSLTELRHNAENEITKLHEQYKIDVASPGERPFLDRSFALWKGDCPMVSGSRTPRLFDLRIFEAALRQSQPSQLSKDGKQGIKLYFLTGNDRPEADAFYSHADKDGRQFLAIQPYRSVASMTIMKRNYMHELVHNAQHNRGWSDSTTFSAPQLPEHLLWIKRPVSPTKDNDQTAERLPVLGKFAKHLFFCYEPDIAINTPKSEKGKEIAGAMGWQLDATGAVVGLKAVDGLVYEPTTFGRNIGWQSINAKLPCLQIQQDSDAMQKLAVLGTATNYFPDPSEMFAENMTSYRDHRQSELSPQMLQVMQKEDQAEINQVYGMAKNGQPKRIRNDNDFLVDNPACNVKQTCNSDTTSASK